MDYFVARASGTMAIAGAARTDMSLVDCLSTPLTVAYTARLCFDCKVCQVHWALPIPSNYLWVHWYMVQCWVKMVPPCALFAVYCIHPAVS